VIVQVPGSTGFSTEPETVQTDGVCELNETCSPDDADAVKVTWCPTVVSGGGEKVSVWERTTGLTRNDRVTGVAAKMSALPPWEAVIVQGPGASGLATEPDTVHTAGVSELSETNSPDDADAFNMTRWPTIVSVGCAKVIICEIWPTADREPRAGGM
jgi:hypothetical protein